MSQKNLSPKKVFSVRIALLLDFLIEKECQKLGVQKSDFVTKIFEEYFEKQSKK